MPRVKRVRFVGEEEHARIVSRLRAEIAAKEEELRMFDRAFEEMADVTDDLVEKMKDLTVVSNRTRKWRDLLEVRKDMAMACCGRPGCRRMVFCRLADLSPAWARKCIECTQADNARFREIADSVFGALDVPLRFPSSPKWAGHGHIDPDKL
jgi:hypothetical protein